MIKKSRIINEKSKIIPIKIVNTKSEYNTFSNSSNNINSNINSNTYYSNKSYFDPSKSSPPNDFMNKLYLRLTKRF